MIWKYAKKIESEVDPGTKLVFDYEAGCLGFSFYERITKMGFECHIMAPTTIRLAQTDRVRKTDRRDAKSLAEALAYDTYRSVYVPTQEDQEVRSFLYNGHFYRLTKDQPTYETQFLPDGTEAHYFLEEYLMNSKTGKFDNEKLIDVFADLDDVIENCSIQGIKFKDVIISPQVNLEGVD